MKQLSLKHFSLDVRNLNSTNIGVLSFDLKNEKVNKFNREVMAEFGLLIKELKLNPDKIDVLVLVSPKPGMFIAGADIQLIQSAKNEDEAFTLARQGQTLLNEWEDLPFPRVVAINGACLGGGCELSLASTAIVMSNHPSAKIGLPEVLLGFVPGMGGCVRLPWKVGIATALELILAGKTLGGEKAQKAGLADACLPQENFESTTLEWVVRNLPALKSGARIAKPPKLGGSGGAMGSFLESNCLGRNLIFSKAREGVIQKTKGNYPAPLAAIELIQQIKTGFRKNFRGEKRDQAMIQEAKTFAKLSVSDVSKNSVRLFFMTEALKKSNGLPEGNTVSTVQVSQAAVLGAGVMGGGIAQLFADKGIGVRMKDIQNAGLEIGVQSALTLFQKALKRKSITHRQLQQKLNRISPTTSFDGFRSTEVVVEAIIEKMEIKQSALRDLESFVSDECVIATNTSSLSVSEMQTALKRPDRFVGMHFFNPVHKMPLIEVIRGSKSSDRAVAQIFQLSKQIGKMPIVVKDSPGFLVNRLLMPYLTEAAILLDQGVPVEEIDSAMIKFGMPMGPIELIDEVGLDVAEKVGQILHRAFGDRLNPPKNFEKLVAEKRLGKKTGSGFYVYSGKDRSQKKIESSLYGMLGIQQRPGSVSAEEIVQRCVYTMINEAARCLEEQVVARPDDVDLGMIMGTGFPPFRGGLLRFADSVGLDSIAKTLAELAKKQGSRFVPSEAFAKFQAAKGRFYPNV